MAEKESSFGEIKKAVIGVITLAITTAGGLFIANMEKIFDGDDEVKQEVVTEPIKTESSKDTIVVIQKEKTENVANSQPSKEKKEFDW
jgi:hypothetical protein